MDKWESETQRIICETAVKHGYTLEWLPYHNEYNHPMVMPHLLSYGKHKGIACRVIDKNGNDIYFKKQ